MFCLNYALARGKVCTCIVSAEVSVAIATGVTLTATSFGRGTRRLRYMVLYPLSYGTSVPVGLEPATTRL
jgi:hypothetical protein